MVSTQSESTPRESIRLRAATRDDETLFRELFVATLPVALRLSPLADVQWRAHSAGLSRYGASLEDRAVLYEGRTVGRLLVDVEGAALRVVDVALLPEWRRRGIGAAVLADVQLRAVRLGLPVVLSVQRGNEAARLYERLGFQVVSADELFLTLWWQRPTTFTHESKEVSCPNHS